MGRWDWDGIGVCLLAFAVYINTLGHGFVYDDNRAIISNPDVQPSNSILQVFQNDLWGTPLSSSSSHGSYRPLCVLSFRLNSLTSGLQPFSFHLTNVLLHVVATALVLKTARVLLPKKSPTLAAAIFAVHPIHVEAVAGVVGRADVLAAIFYLMSFLFYVNHVKFRENSSLYIKTVSKTKSLVKKCAPEKKSVESFATSMADFSLKFLRNVTWLPRGEIFYFSLFVVFSILAVLSKEPGITVIPLAICYDIILHLRSRRFLAPRSAVVSSVSTSLLSFITILCFRLYIMGMHIPKFSKADNPTAKEGSIVMRTLTLLYLPVFNFQLLVLPRTLSFDWSMNAIPRVQSVFEYRFILAMIFYYLLYRAFKYSLCLTNIQKSKHVLKPKSCKVCNTVSGEEHLNICKLLNNNNLPHKCICLNSHSRTLNVGSTVMLCLAFIVIPFIPASNLLFYVGFVVAERVLYIPSIGFCLLVALGAHVIWSCGKRSLVLISCSLLLAALSGRTLQRNRDWRDEESLYQSATSINPPKAYGNLGSVLSTAGRLQEAETALRLALQYRPNMADVHYNLGNLLNRQGKLEEAVKSYEDAIKYRPTLAVAYLNLAQVLEILDHWKYSENLYGKCVKLDVDGLKDPRSHEEARASCLRLLKRLCWEKPCGTDTIITLFGKEEMSRILEKNAVSGNTEMRKISKTKMEYASYNNNPRNSFAQFTVKNKTAMSAEEEFLLRALQKAPVDPAVYVNYGRLLVQQGRKGEAAGLYVRAAELAPHQHTLVTSAAVALRHAGKLAEAERLYRQARDLRPLDATSHSNLGAILHLQGKYQQAAFCYREALHLAPGDRVTLTNLQKLKNLLAKSQR